VQQWRIGDERVFATRRHAKRLVIDPDQFRGVLGEITRGRDHGDDGLADVTDLACGQRHDRRRVIIRHPRDRDQRLEFAGDGFRRQHRDHARRALCRRGVDRRDPRMRLVAAAKGDMERAIRFAVGAVLAASGEQPRIFGALDRRADMARPQHVLRMGAAVATHNPRRPCASLAIAHRHDRR
jgi:hypothetical protein